MLLNYVVTADFQWRFWHFDNVHNPLSCLVEFEVRWQVLYSYAMLTERGFHILVSNLDEQRTAMAGLEVSPSPIHCYVDVASQRQIWKKNKKKQKAES